MAQGLASLLLCLCLCLACIAAAEEGKSNIRVDLTTGQESGPVVMYHESSGLRLQADGTNSHMLYAQAEKGAASGVDSNSALVITADGFIQHRASGKCLGPEEARGAVLDARVVLSDCHGPQMLWNVKKSGSLLHVGSGLCVHPNGGSPYPVPETVAIFHSPCDEPRINFIITHATDPPPVEFIPAALDANLNIGGSRDNTLHNSPACCYSEQCLVPHTHKHAFLTPVRTKEYINAAKNLACSLAKTNPGSTLIILGAEGDSLTAEEVTVLRSLSSPELLVEYMVVPDLSFPSYTNARFGRNWIKLYAWSLTDYDAIVMLDSDLTVVGDLTHMFHLPTHFAWSPYQGVNYPYNGGGFYFLRPCKAVFEHMVKLLQRNRALQFRQHFAEQSFLGWYFGYEGFRLSWIYNTNAHQHADLPTNGTATGLRPIVIHFADQKPWDLPPDSPLRKYANACSDDFPARPPHHHAHLKHTREHSVPRRLAGAGKESSTPNAAPG